MKILLVSMNSIHFQRWTDQLKDSGHDLYWFHILDGGYSNKLPWVNQIVDWKQKYPNLKGRIFIKKKFPRLYKKLSFLIENDVKKIFEEKLKEIKPDLVHSFVLYISCTPILKVMQKYYDLPWIYSSWGSDLYYFKEIPKYKQDILKVLSRINYLFADCKRDTSLARNLGFKGGFLGVYPGGGGFNYKESDAYIRPISERKTILIKGYQGRSGKAIEVLKALEAISNELKNYNIIVFGGDEEVANYIVGQDLSKKLAVKTLLRKDFLPHNKILELMGEALIYIGNSNSDGMPNTLLEAIAQGAFPIQSNPGGASAEVIEHHENGLLIEDCNSIEEIKNHVLTVIENSELLERAFGINLNRVKPKFERALIKKQVLEAYKKVLKS
ncbi:glycosyltransferase [Flavivirga spongiicola]|uniref:Glycosyltransferase n=1 Tax=Flavivirga spongiicola TaxID=421621 RepID=A0ABU7XQ76_9FLAO|nr:glycosyltransferase [Flavivirga sp. MEBiC05379]MDO5981666.1 glycosyltransferase [Flavivirga sp. MEBiC05379]